MWRMFSRSLETRSTGKQRLHNFRSGERLEWIENKFRASRVDGWTGRPRECFTRNFLSPPVFSHGPLTSPCRRRKLLICEKSIHVSCLSRSQFIVFVLVQLHPWPVPVRSRLFVLSRRARASEWPLDSIISSLVAFRRCSPRCKFNPRMKNWISSRPYFF